jgi:hypothetical protein
MTGEEMERAIEFLLQSQASFEERLVVFEAQQRRTDAQIAETGRQLQAYAQTQSEFIRATTESITGLSEAQAKTDERLNKLIGLFEQHIIAGH